MPRAPRRSPVPDAPSYSRRELEVLEEVEGPLGFVLWRVISDVLVWARASASERGGLFGGGRAPLPEEGIAAAGDAADDLRSLASLDAGADPARVAAACIRVAEWAEKSELKGAALQFAELSAWAAPETSAYAWAAGRLCRRSGEFERAKLWLRRALRLARVKGNEIDFANAHRGLGFVFVEEGDILAAEPHFWKSVRAALRAGRNSLAGAGYHDLLLAAVHLDRRSEAFDFARKATNLYKIGHPRFPILAHDIGYFWCRCGYYSSALPVFEEVLPLVERLRERILVQASLARSAAVVRDNIRFQRAAARVIALAERDDEMAASSLYHVAEGARCFEDWDRAERLARNAYDLARLRRNETIIRKGRELLDSLALRLAPECDRVPEEGGLVDQTRETLLRKLRRHAVALHRSSAQDRLEP
jgi:tetratricopeptide (TPR) repeat protein